MSTSANFIAFDLGASNGRALLGRWNGERFDLEELHRFDNGPVHVHGNLYWDVLRLWQEILTGLARYAAVSDQPPAGIGIDTWGVDFALLDRAGNLLGNPRHYRDPRTNGIFERAWKRVPRRRIFERTGLQFLQFNTLYQVFSMAEANDPQLAAADKLLMVPDLFNYWLTGRAVAEYTDSSTTQFLLCQERRWDTELLEEMGIPARIMPEIVQPGTILGELRQEIVAEAGWRHTAPVIASASHDTASAVAAIPGLDENSAYISSGTWSLMGIEVGEPIVNERALELNFTNEGGVAGTIRFLKNIAGLWLLQESRRQWRRAGRDYSWGELMALGDAAEPFRSLINPDDIDFLAPGDMPATIAAFCRRTSQPEPRTPGEVVRCCHESLALKYRQVFEALEELAGHRLESIRVVGGGSQNRSLCQLTADACGRPVIAGPVEATALGNLVVQAIATGHLPDLQAGRKAIGASTSLETYMPRQSNGWDAAYQRFLGLLEHA